MKVKNLIIGDICTLYQTTVYEEDYASEHFSERCILPRYEKESIFYRYKNHAYDLKSFRRYKLVKIEDTYPEKLRNKKVVIFDKAFSDISDQENISRRKAIKEYTRTKN